MRLKLLLLLLGVIVMQGASANEPRLYIRSLFDIQYAFCDIKTNGVTGFSNRNSAREGRGFGTGSTASIIWFSSFILIAGFQTSDFG
ncbi:hypothetical protein [Photorhabdus namnaonensis]|uniref:Uncharacterized protein n=1 Tax=Photorhabdus namnaonensis TaxID=1851568 RepID=A0A1B8YKM6_9GAMM|nr:hypothetical protein [Photorhabdus namnaonensis]OCA55681.1 hypothetical protein Phpb_01228 [Photorhabdus namnaonensis]